MTVKANDNYTTHVVEVTSEIPAFNNDAAQTQQIRLAYAEWGEPTAPAERTFVMAHGITGNREWWHTLAHALLSVNLSPVRVIAYDERGRGDSDKPEDGPYSVAAHSADIAGLLDALNIDGPINLVGHSLGAHIGAYFASHYPERVRRLTLIDGGARLPADVAESIASSMNRVGKVFASQADYFAPLKAAGIFPQWEGAVERAYTYDCTPGPDGQGVMSKVSPAAIRLEWENLPAYYAEVDDYYPRITAPTTIVRAPRPIAAHLSPFLTPDILQLMTTTIAGGAKVIELTDTNHYTVILTPTDELITALLS